MRTWQVGDRTTIYDDPLTKRRAEGRATLINPIDGDNMPGLEYWDVRFPGEGATYPRRIAPKGQRKLT